MSAAATASSKSRRASVLKGVVVAVAGNLGPGWTDSDVARWLAYNGGRFSTTVTDEVTHVLCTRETYAQCSKAPGASPVLRAALRRGPAHVHIVLRDWLEDSLNTKRRRREAPYLLSRLQRAAAQAPDAVAARLAQRRAKGRQQAETNLTESFLALYRVYRDATGFAYKVTISRDHAACGIFGERYVLYLFESNARPCLYWFAARHYKSRTHTKPRDFRPSGTCQLFATEFAHFCAFFARKTGVAWDARMVGEAPASKRKTSHVNVKTDEAAAATTASDDPDLVTAETALYFRYQKPGHGMPIGVIADQRNMPRPSIGGELVGVERKEENRDK
ncbi:brct domain containing protein [Niveomyces insectorum RCEF 264]|uniref:Brct domain containing protein n=1 Tax=Niveomyces insectorum RCEF 264 TaxID=1081102 RepID=A0A167QX82_9HYPO|nr:brct domain containing protein [Niveomyces insectorum RCEF 264]